MARVIKFTRKKKKIESLPEFEAVIDTLPVLIVVLDGRFRVLLANKTCCQAFGLKEEQLVGKGISELLAPKPIKQRSLNRLISMVMETGQPIELKEVR